MGVGQTGESRLVQHVAVEDHKTFQSFVEILQNLLLIFIY